MPGSWTRALDGLAAGAYDAVVLAAGAWTPGLLRALGLPAEGYRTRSIQYTVYDAGPVRPPAFADERTGLYGLPTADGGMLIGLPTGEWDVPAGPGAVTGALHERACRVAAACLPGLKLGPARHRVAAADCFADPPVLALRPVGGRRRACSPSPAARAAAPRPRSPRASAPRSSSERRRSMPASPPPRTPASSAPSSNRRHR